MLARFFGAWFNSARFWVTGADRLAGYFGHGHAQRKTSVAELAPQRVLARPAPRVVRWEEFDVQDGAGRFDRGLELRGQDLQVPIELHGEGQEIVVLVRQRADHRPDAMRTKRLAGAQFGDDEVEQLAARGVIRSRQ